MKQLDEITISFRASFNAPIRDVNLMKYLKSDYYKPLLDKIRAEEDKDVRSDLKRSLGAITPSGRFRTAMKDEELVEHSGLLCVDIDAQDNKYTAQSMKDVVCKLDSVAYAAFSASGNGVFALVRIDPDKHLKSFQYIEQFFREELDINIDGQCKNLARLRFASNDPDHYINDNAVELNIGDWEKPKQEQVRSFNDVDTTGYEDFATYCGYYEKEFLEGNRNRWVYNKMCKARDKFGMSKNEALAAMDRYVSSGFTTSEMNTTARSVFG